MSDPLISVIMPVFNGGQHLHESITSVLNQTVDDFEFLIINDGSTDNTKTIIKSYTDSRITLIDNKINLGLAASLNKGINLARGVYIARMDADDVAFPERFEYQNNYLRTHPEVDLLGCRAVVFRDSNEIIGLLPFFASHQAICNRPWRGVPLPHPTWMGKVEWFRNYRYASPEVLRAEDQELLLRAYPTSCFACLNEVLMGYRQSTFNLGKTLLARRTLLKAQAHIFINRSQWKNLFLTIIASLLKVLVDLVAALFLGGNLFFMRMAEPAPESAINKLKSLTKDLPRLKKHDNA